MAAGSGGFKFTPHRIYPRFLESMHRCKRSFTNTKKVPDKVYRIVKNDRWATPDHIFSGVGSMKFGGRYNVANQFRASYTSLRIETSVAERLHYARKFAAGKPISVHFWESYVLGTADVKPEMLDLTTRHVIRELGIQRSFLLGNWEAAQRSSESEEALTQALGRAACVSKIGAIVVPSARDDGYNNLVVFPGNLSASQEPSNVEIGTVPKEFWCF